MFSTFGDMATAYHSRSMSAHLKSNITRLGRELVTGQQSDISSAVSGDFRPIASIEHDLTTLKAYKTATDEAATIAGTIQVSLGAIQDQSQALSAGLMTAAASQNATMVSTTALDAKHKLESAVSQLNTSVMGRSLFSGSATDTPPLISGSAMLDALQTEIAGAGTAVEVSNRIDAWFDDPAGGFITTAYQGSDTPSGPIRLGNGETADFSLNANDASIKDVLKAIAKSAIMANGALNGDLNQQIQLSQIASKELLTANDGIVMARAEIGTVEARIETAKTQNKAEKSGLEIARNNLISADPYETATELQAAYGQLESLYTVTARLSKLNFTDYMR